MTRRSAFAPVLGALLALAVFFLPTAGEAFCGFYVGGAGAKMFNDATVVVMMREGTRTVLSMQNAYKGPPEKFAMVVPVPVVLQQDNVKTLKRELFDHIDQLASPRLVEYWEQDPCAPQVAFAPGAAKGAMPAPPSMAAPVARGDLGVKIEAQFTVGEYQIVILSAKDSGGLDTWLHREGYNIPEGGEPYFRPYVAAGSKFFVAKVDVTKVKMENGLALLSPLRFHYDSDEFKLPVRLGLINSSGTQDLIIHILGRGRYEVANYPNVTIPTNLDVSEAASDKFGTFYTSLFDRTVEKNPKAVVTEYAWEPTSCDPCPGPAMNLGDLSTFGADVLPKDTANSGGQFVLTRLHLRYTKESLGEDISFRSAPPIVGGREMTSAEGTLEHGAAPSSYNNFQARYAIRHGWTGPIACKEPRRGVWGAKPGSNAYEPAPPKAAQKLGLAPHVKTELASFVKQDIPEIGFTRSAAATAPGTLPTAAPTATPSATPSAATTAGDAGGGKRGCMGCAVTANDAPATAPWLVGFGLAALLLRRKRLES
jgi:hypothetical protein